MRNKDQEEFLLYLDLTENVGKTLEEIMTGLGWSEDRTKKAMKNVEYNGMIRGNWEQHPEKEWVRRFFIGGEGTRDYIETLKKYRGGRET